MTNLDQERVERAAEASYHSRSRNKPYRLLSMFQRDRLVADARAAITAYLGDTHVVVPREPTEAMLTALHDDVAIACSPLRREASILNDRQVWRAMIFAAHPGKEG